MNKQNGSRFIDTKNKIKFDKWGRVWGLGEKGEGIRTYEWVVTK